MGLKGGAGTASQAFDACVKTFCHLRGQRWFIWYVIVDALRTPTPAYIYIYIEVWIDRLVQHDISFLHAGVHIYYQVNLRLDVHWCKLGRPGARGDI